MSEKITQALVDTQPVKLRGFPTAWLRPQDNDYVIDRIHWNTEPAPDDHPQTHFSVDWGDYFGTRYLTHWAYGVEIAGLIMRLYFGIDHCTIPVACLPYHDVPVFVFTLAGPCSADGKKGFYLHVYDSLLEANMLVRLRPAFSSVADFHLNRKAGEREPVAAVAGGAEATRAALTECGFHKPRVEGFATPFDWSSDESDE